MKNAIGRATSTLILSAIAAATLVPASRAQDSQSPEASFVEKVQPIVFKNCTGCHTYGGHAGGLKLDSYDNLMKGGDLGAVIVPGDPGASILVRAIRREAPGPIMPPIRPVADDDVAVIVKWVESLAPMSASAAKATATREAVPAEPAAPTPAVTRPAQAASVSAASAPPAVASTVSKPAPPASNVPPPKITPEQEQFFEAKIRPLLTKNCYACHTLNASGGLHLDSREAVLKGGKDGAVVVPGNPEDSMLVSAIHYDSKLKMPPTGQLKTEEIAAIEQWVRDGLPWPTATATSVSSKVTDAQRNHWSFRPPARPAVPTVKSTWAYNDVDRFVLAKLAEKQLKPVGDADKRTLIRRVTYDLTGLPPTSAEVQAFVDDKSTDAYEKLVDRLLASKAYGERWGRKWLDIVRYADTGGGDGDFPIPQAHKYRDYVIDAFNGDKPYDRFIREQIAGDLLPAESEPEKWQNYVATGYLAETIRAEGRPAAIADATDNLGSAFLGLTVGCARCHNHKFDPIPTADYYAMYGILSSTHLPEPGSGKVRFQTGFVYRDPQALNRDDWKIFQTQLKPVQDAIEAVLKLPGTYDDLVPQLQARRMHLFEHMPDLGESAYAVTEGQPEDAKIQRYGDPKELGEQVRRGFLQVLGGGPLPPDVKGSGRMELADWIANPENPLTSRVIVNRIWQGHFGRGIVATANDFGTRGVPPSNQELLDYLAWKLVDNGWSIKSLHKEMLLSHAYRLSSADSAANEEIDPDNSYIWRHSRSRMDAEQLRDSMLMISDLLDRSPAGAHPFPHQAEWNWEDQNHFSPDVSKYETDRRTVYTMVQRDVKLPYFTLFDGPNTNASTEQRSSSLTPLQALYFLNGAFPRRASANLASRLFATEKTEQSRVQQAFLGILGRSPSKAEMDRSISFLHNTADAYATNAAQGTTPQQSAFEEFLKAMFATNEFMFIE